MAKKIGIKEAKPDRAPRPSAVVAIGMCRASLESLQRLFADLPIDLGAAYLVAVSQKNGLQVEAVLAAIQEMTGMTASIAADGQGIEPNQVYVGGRDALVTLEDHHLRSRPAGQPVEERGAIDSLLISVSEAYHEHSVAVVLGGLGNEGTAGAASTKSCGGLSICEQIDGEEPAPDAVSAAGIVDLLLPAGKIAAQIAAYVGNLHHLDQADALKGLQQEADPNLARIAAILRSATGNDFHGYKQNTFLRRVARRMQVLAIDDVGRYIERLRGDAEEVRHLFQDLLIGVTQFFRDPAEFELIERQALPEIFDGRGPDDRVRVWVVGCATGEEAYSLAMLLREQMARMDTPPMVQIFATDLDARALAVARAGRYPETIARHVPPERLARWFVREGETYCVTKELREMCIFSPHNVLKDAPFSRIDLVSCRNLLIYLNTDLQSRVIPIFHFALNPGGFLVLGNSENVTRHPKLFAPLDRKSRVFRKLETTTRVLPEFPLGQRATREPPRRAGTTELPHPFAGAVSRRAEQIADRYAPAYVVVDERGEVLHFSGRTGRYIEPMAGAASLNLLNLVHRDLRLDLRAALQRAAAHGERAETARLPVQIDGAVNMVSMAVEPIAGEQPPTMVVLFQDGGQAPEEALGSGEYSNDHVQRLEGELRVTKDRLQATIEELESTNEELKSSNEEYQSINEELQSANEELETSKEELQSVNEELQTVNHELSSRVAELGRSNSDLKNLLESTQLATIFLDNDLRVRSFTPTATDVFHLMESDSGRPIAHIAPRISYPELQDDARRVIRTLSPAEREVAGEGGQRYIARTLPYRSIDNFIAGAVVTFTNVSERARAEEALRTSEERLKLLLAELQHRVRNTLSVVRSIARRTATTADSVEDYAAHLDGRINAFARTQAAVTRDPSAGLSLDMMVGEELLAHAAREGDQVSIHGPPLRFRSKSAESMALAIHELATNSMKYGGLSVPDGRVDVSWTIAPDGDGDRLAFDWTERAGSIDGGVPARRGFGFELLERTLVYDLRAETSLDFQPGVFRCNIGFRLDNDNVHRG